MLFWLVLKLEICYGVNQGLGASGTQESRMKYWVGGCPSYKWSLAKYNENVEGLGFRVCACYYPFLGS
jgi:hypothetical protein